MKNTMKLCLMMIACNGITLYPAERLNPDKIIRESFATGKPIDNAIMNQLLQQNADMQEQQNLQMYKMAVENYIAAQQPVPARIISHADQETAALAHVHNQNLQQQLLNQDQK